MSWNHIQTIMNDIGGSAVIVEDGVPRYVVVPIEEWERVRGGALPEEPSARYEEVPSEAPTHNHPFAAEEPSLEYEESPLETLDTFESPSYPV